MSMSDTLGDMLTRIRNGLQTNKTIVEAPSSKFRANVLEVLKRAGFSFTQGYKIKIFGDIPINAGISSSSALVVAWILFLLQTQDHTVTLKNSPKSAVIGLMYERPVLKNLLTI